MICAAIIITLLIQSTWGYNEDNYELSDNLENSYLYPEDYQDNDDNNEFEIRRRNNNNFLKFSRNEEDEDFTRPTRSGSIERKDHFIRFGRNKDNHVRFGRNLPSRVTRDRTTHLRFGRSIDEENKKRNKRDLEYNKRAGSNFMRFGRNSNFLRFGRNNGFDFLLPTDLALANNDLDNKMHSQLSSPLIQLLTELLENIKKLNNNDNKCLKNVV